MYSLNGYGEMIADRIRVEAFMQALHGAIRPGAVVIDIGTGPGTMAVQACRFGAKRVYAIESGDVIQVAREVATANDCANKIEFFNDLSKNVTIADRADIIVSDMRGVLPLFQGHIPSIADARQRFLAPGGILIARKDRIWAAVVEAPETYGKIVDPWERNVYGQDLAVAKRKVLNEFRKTRVKEEQLLTKPQLWATLDYATIENSDVRSTLQWTAKRNGIGHGILVWFDMELAEGINFSSGPAAPETIYGAALFPWLEAVSLTMGQEIRVELEAKLMEKDYLWRWITQIESTQKTGETAARFDQSQLQGAILSPPKLRRMASDFVPQLAERGIMGRRALELMDGKSSLEEIARGLTAEFPGRFSRWQQALTFVGSISDEYSR